MDTNQDPAPIHRVGLLLAGCGRLDGTDPIPAVLALTALDEADVDVFPCAPSLSQHDALDPRTAEPLPPRSVPAEAARLGLGRCHPAGTELAETLDGLVVPGGLGVVKTLWPTAVEGPGAAVDPATLALLLRLHARGRPVLAFDEGVALVGGALRAHRVRLAGGVAGPLTETLSELGHEVVDGDGPTVDPSHRVVSLHTPAGRDPRDSARTVRTGLEQLRRLWGSETQG